jgi:radical SAM-linked protein
MPELTGERAPSTPIASGAADKVRLCVSKGGPLRWLSHHDLLRTFERMLRRASIPFRRSKGFNPHPRIVFALSLPLGVIGRQEVVEVELDERVEPEEVRRRVAEQAPSGLEVLRAERIPPRARARVVGLWYGVQVPADRRQAAREGVAALLAADDLPVRREKPAPRTVNIRPFIKDARFDEASGWLEVGLHLTASGTARPEEVLRVIGLGGITEQGAVLERTRLDWLEDTPDDGTDGAPVADPDDPG